MKKLEIMFEQYRWYYNATVAIVYQHYGADKITDVKSYSNRSIRNLIRKYEYTEEEFEHLVFQSFEYKEERNETPIPPWWNKNEVNNRLPRGASDKFTSSLNSAISNYKNRNVKHFEMKFMSKKKPTEYLHFEDKSFPSFIRKIKSNYWFTNSNGRRDRISFSDIKTIEKGIEIIYEKDTGRYFLHYPVDRNWFPEEDRRNESQVKFISEGDRIISLDPGVRKFLVGYDPRGESIFIGEDAHIELTKLLVEIDKTTTHEIKSKLWRKVKNLVAELHWKTISFLVENYDIILLPDFRVSQMVKGKKLARITKRLLMMFSFHSFKEKLKYKCSMYNKKLIIVDESYTSCTCGRCGNIKRTKLEVYSCDECGLVIDRDATGSRNIFIKNSRLRCPQV
jgi:IS605 OrfB family transposase